MGREINFDIDKMNIVEELERHAGDIAHVGELLAERKGAVYSKSAALKAARGELSQAIRADPAEYGLEKVTEAAITEAVAGDTKIKKLEAALAYAQLEESAEFGRLEALRAKTAMLQSLVSLHNTLWFGSPPSGAGAAGRKQKARLKEID